MSFITILFDVPCYNFVSRVPSGYYYLNWKKISSIWPHLKVIGYRPLIILLGHLYP